MCGNPLFKSGLSICMQQIIRLNWKRSLALCTSLKPEMNNEAEVQTCHKKEDQSQ